MKNESKRKEMMIYLDMDGVLADFFKGLEDKYEVNHWKDIPNIQGALDSLKNTDFFYKLETFKEVIDGHQISKTSQIIKFVKELCGTNWGICSSPLRGDEYNSAYHKRRWLEKYGYTPLTQNIIFTANKHKYAVSPVDGKPNILVDDKPSNIARWVEAGGIGIPYQANENDLDNYLFPLLEANYK
jgi:hypothetical protein